MFTLALALALAVILFVMLFATTEVKDFEVVYTKEFYIVYAAFLIATTSIFL